MKKLKKFIKKYLPLVVAASIFLLPFGNLKAFAAISTDVGYVSPSINGSSGVTNQNNAIDSNSSTYALVSKGATSYFDFNAEGSSNGYIYYQLGAGNTVELQFFNASGGLLGTVTLPNHTSTSKVSFTIPGGTSIVRVAGNSNASTYLFEMEVSAPIIVVHDEISNMSVGVNATSANITYSIPSGNSHFTGSKIYRNGNLIATQSATATSYTDNGLTYNTTYTYTVTATYDDGVETTGATKQVKVIEPHNEITNLGATVATKSVNLSWSLPNNQFLVGFKIYRNGVLIKILNTVENYYEDDGVKPGTSYTYKVTSLYDDGYETTGVSNTFTTNTEPHDEVSTVDATVSFDSTLITWSAPNNPYLVGFKVYRDSVLVGTLKSTDSYFQDTRLNESTAYQYKITSIYDDGYETFGVPITATTTAKPHDEVVNLTISSTYNSASLSWERPDNQFLMGFNVYKDGTLVQTLDPSVTTYKDDGLEQGTTYTYKVVSVYDDGYTTTGAVIKATTQIVPHDEATNLNATTTNNSASLTWDVPNNPYLVGFNIYQNGKLVKNLSTILNSYEDNGLIDLTDYKYTITSVYVDGFETPGISNTFKTLEDPVSQQVSNAKAEAVSYKQVNVSWDLPNQGSFKKVKIYRAVKPKSQGFFSGLLGTVVFADTAPQEIFETNGTYFNDLTVQPDTSYQYTLQTESVSGNVSDPINVTADTPSEPTPVYSSNGTYSVNQDGSYVFKWDQPTTGTVKIQIAGQDYKTVDASQQQITIPKTAMKTTIWGDPDISAIPVGEFGTNGKVVALGGSSFQSALSMPIKSTDLLTTIMGFVGIVAPILLLVLVILYFKPIKRMIEKAALQRKTRRGK